MASVRSPAPSPSLVAEVQERYRVGPLFARAYLEYWQRSREQTYRGLAEILGSPDPLPMWFDFAMSANYRGRRFLDAHRPHVRVPTGRYLDVGCGFGGFLVAFAEAGFDVLGIEPDPVRAELSRANCRDAGLEDVVREMGLLDEEVRDGLGRFDVVTCVDVIEHVLDVPGSLERLADLLLPGGVLLLEIPNKDSIEFVRSDGHFSLFGITQLSRERAIEYHRRFFDFEYDVGHYHPLEYYVRALEGHGLRCSAFPAPLHGRGRPFRGLAALLREWRRFRRDRGRLLPEDLRADIEGRVASFAASALRAALGAAAGVGDRRVFEMRYLRDFWTLVAEKPATA